MQNCWAEGRRGACLAQVCCEGHHLAVVGLLQPLQDDAGVEAPRVGQHDLVHLRTQDSLSHPCRERQLALQGSGRRCAGRQHTDPIVGKQPPCMLPRFTHRADARTAARLLLVKRGLRPDQAPWRPLPLRRERCWELRAGLGSPQRPRQALCICAGRTSHSRFSHGMLGGL